MRPLRTRLQEARDRTGLTSLVIEQDYLLSWILAGVSQVPALGDLLVFKGGTALKKYYFGDYRFSEDLDFSGRPGTPSNTDMERYVGQVCEVANRLVEEHAPVEITYRRYTEREAHPGGHLRHLTFLRGTPGSDSLKRRSRSKSLWTNRLLDQLKAELSSTTTRRRSKRKSRSTPSKRLSRRN